MTSAALVYGLAVTGVATTRALVARGWRVTVADDRVTDATRATAAELGVELVEAPTGASLTALVAGVELVTPSPGLPERHPLFAVAVDAGVPVRSELELAYGWEQARPGGPRPMVAVTGTDGKTTTTLMATAMVEASGRRAAAAGNTELPLVEAIDRDVDAFVVECSSFRLAFTERFRTEAAVWLNLAPDHQDWHRSMDGYEEAKARLWDHQRPADAAIGNADDPIVMARLAVAPGRHVTFGTGGDYHVDGAELRGPQGTLTSVADLRRALPHDVTDALAAAAGVLEADVATRRRCRRRPGRLHRAAAPDRARGHGRRGRVVRRLQGHDAARRGHGHPRLPRRRAAGRRAQQGVGPRSLGRGGDARPRRRRAR